MDWRVCSFYPLLYSTLFAWKLGDYFQIVIVYNGQTAFERRKKKSNQTIPTNFITSSVKTNAICFLLLLSLSSKKKKKKKKIFLNFPQRKLDPPFLVC